MISEGKTIEFKRQYVDDIKNTVTAFANCDGGRSISALMMTEVCAASIMRTILCCA